MTASAITCVIADEHPPILDAVRRALESSGEVVGQAIDGEEAVRVSTGKEIGQ